MNTTINVPALVLDPDYELTAEEIADGADHFVEIETLRSDPVRARLTLSKELEILASNLRRVRSIAIYLNLWPAFQNEIRKLAKI
jgi:hypothetical protein